MADLVREWKQAVHAPEVAELRKRIAELEAECAAAGKMETALVKAAHRLWELGDKPEHPVRCLIEDAINAYAPVVE